jgi:hypothetical protein
MNETLTYLHRHPWQRRFLTVGLAMVLGLLAAIIVYPHWRDYILLRELGSRNPQVRYKAIEQAAAAVKKSPRTADRLVAALDTDDDVQFFAIVRALNAAGLFATPDRNPIYIDRAQAIELEGIKDAQTRRLLLAQFIRSRRDNRYVRRAMRLAARDNEVEIRTRSALLAAMLGDDAVLRALLSDKAPPVRAAAALDAGIARRGALAKSIASLLNDSEMVAASSAAFALARLNPQKYSQQICKLLLATADRTLRDRLLHVATVLNNDEARSALRATFQQARTNKKFPAPMAMLAAGKLRLAEAAKDVRAVLAAATQDPKDVSILQVHAALEAAAALEVPVRKEANAICRTWWGSRGSLMLISAARLLGAQAVMNHGQNRDAPTLQECKRTLMQAARYSSPMRPGPATAPAATLTPVPSAAAAVACWTIAPSAKTFQVTDKTDELRQPSPHPDSAGAFVVMDAARADTTLAGDYIAWHLWRTGRPEAFELGLKMLPPLDAPQPLRVHNENLRGTGAMLLALSAHTARQKRTVTERITSRLVGGRLGGEDSYILAGTYRCALLALSSNLEAQGQAGRKDLVRSVRQQRDSGGHPLRTAITALCAAGETEVLEWLLVNTQISTEDLAYWMVYKGLGEVLAFYADRLPTVDAAAGNRIRLWQTRILQDYYAIHGESIRLKPSR